ncbi:MAG: FeoA family protein [Candidatus Sumerlaeaceae bacterium]
MVKCPNCGMEMPREPHPLARLKQWLFGKKLPAESVVPPHDGLCQRPGFTLAEIPPGRQALVERFLDPTHVRKFLSLGVLPGTTLTVLKQSPAVVVRVGYSEFAFDKALAQTVLVRRV